MEGQVLDAAVILNITPDHLDRYGSMEKYAEAKLQIRHHLKEGAPLFMLEKEARLYQSYLHGTNVKTFGSDRSCTIKSDGKCLIVNEKIEHILPVGYRGAIGHNAENLLAAYALCRTMGALPADLVAAAETFQRPSHRIQYVTQRNGVSYFDDSKGTNLDAVLRAVESMNGGVVLIAGGVHKGAPYTAWIEPFRGKVKHICAIGQAAPQIYQDLSKEFSVELCDGLEQAVKKAAAVAAPGENVLLSPGCSSFDMFRDYAHRGDQFQKIVQQLVRER
jgi:UDP-N-acetylmuramoylalanine--D-glutamate ligase